MVDMTDAADGADADGNADDANGCSDIRCQKT